MRHSSATRPTTLPRGDKTLPRGPTGRKAAEGEAAGGCSLRATRDRTIPTRDSAVDCLSAGRQTAPIETVAAGKHRAGTFFSLRNLEILYNRTGSDPGRGAESSYSFGVSG